MITVVQGLHLIDCRLFAHIAFVSQSLYLILKIVCQFTIRYTANGSQRFVKAYIGNSIQSTKQAYLRKLSNACYEDTFYTIAKIFQPRKEITIYSSTFLMLFCIVRMLQRHVILVYYYSYLYSRLFVRTTNHTIKTIAQ